MGCDSSIDNVVHANQMAYKPSNFKVKVYIPNSETIRTVTYRAKSDRVPITELINLFFFTSKTEADLDANFISVYNKKTEAFDYYIQRLAGFEIENEENPSKGKMWNFYMNSKKKDWSDICRKNKVIYYKDDLEIKYEAEGNGNAIV